MILRSTRALTGCAGRSRWLETAAVGSTQAAILQRRSRAVDQWQTRHIAPTLIKMWIGVVARLLGEQLEKGDSQAGLSHPRSEPSRSRVAILPDWSPLRVVHQLAPDRRIMP